MTILITGSSGFLGQRVVSALSTGNGREPVVVWSREREGSLLDSAQRQRGLDSLEPSAVLHIAWGRTGSSGYEHSDEHFRWYEASRDFADEARERGIWFGAVGSGADSADSDTPMSAYRDAKMRLRVDLDGWLRAGEVALLRPFHLFDAFELRPRVVRDFLLRDRTAAFEIRNPQAAHDFIHVSDAAAGVGLATDARMSGVINVGTGIRRSVFQLLNSIEPDAGINPADRAPRSSLAEERDQPYRLRAAGWAPIVTEHVFERE
jgi:nucleoside-diphosphate-sugar epimerase